MTISGLFTRIITFSRELSKLRKENLKKDITSLSHYKLMFGRKRSF